MTAILRVLAIVALWATVRAADDGVPEFSDRAIAALNIIHPGSKPVTATVINPHIEMEFREQNGWFNTPADQTFIEAYRYLTEIGPEQQQEACGGYLGVGFPDHQAMFCNVTSLLLGQRPYKNPNEPRLLLFRLSFKSPWHPLFVLDMPILKKPAEYLQLERQAAAQDLLIKWQVDNKVITDIINSDLIDQILQGSVIRPNFMWLTQLLEYGITQGVDTLFFQEPVPFYKFYTRPILQNQDIIEKLIGLVETFNSDKYDYLFEGDDFMSTDGSEDDIDE